MLVMIILFTCIDYKIVIVCSTEDEDKSHIVSKLQLFRRSFIIAYSETEFSKYISDHFISWPKQYRSNVKGRVVASQVDPDRYKHNYVEIILFMVIL